MRSPGGSSTAASGSAPYDVIVLDEAGQVDTCRWAAFARAVGDQPTVVALGDHAQLSSIAAGGQWPLLAKGGPMLTEVRRTRLVWEREAWVHLRSGESAKALDLYARHGKLDICATRGDALDSAVTAWNHDARGPIIGGGTGRRASAVEAFSSWARSALANVAQASCRPPHHVSGCFGITSRRSGGVGQVLALEILVSD
jgi:hypothetical protein